MESQTLGFQGVPPQVLTSWKTYTPLNQADHTLRGAEEFFGDGNSLLGLKHSTGEDVNVTPALFFKGVNGEVALSYDGYSGDALVSGHQSLIRENIGLGDRGHINQSGQLPKVPKMQWEICENLTGTPYQI